MRLILVDNRDEIRSNFHPLTLSRPIWELRCGFSSLADKLINVVKPAETACFVPDYMAEFYRLKTDRPVNDISTLTGDDLLVLDPRIKADSLNIPTEGKSEVGLDDNGNILYARISQTDAATLPSDNIDVFLDAAKQKLANTNYTAKLWNYTWDLVLANPQQLTSDFETTGKYGIEGTVEQPNAIRGNKKDVYIAKGAVVHPMVVIDCENGPVYIESDVLIHPFTRIEGPCYIGKKSILLGAKCREGNSIGPMCRLGGEIEESIIQGHSNKYHAGFLGHAYVGEWVNLGAFTSNSDLKNDYSNVSVVLNGREGIDTGSTKVGSLIGDHTKTSIGTLLNTGSYVGAMTIIMATGRPLPKFIPSFSWFLEGVVTKGFGKGKLYLTAKTAMSRRDCQWTQAEQDMWDAVFNITASLRGKAVKKGRKIMLSR